MAEDESEKSYQWSAREREIAREDADRSIRLVYALNDCRKIVDSTTSGEYRKYLMRSSRHIKRDFKHGVNIEEQLAEEHVLRALFGFVLSGSKGSGEELRNVTKAFRERSKHKVIPPKDPEMFNWPRYIDFKKYSCPWEDLDKILRFVDSLALALWIIAIMKLMEKSKGRQKIRVGKESDNLKFICYTVAIGDTLDLLKKNPDLAEERIGTRFQKPFDNPRRSKWIELSGISPASFYRYWDVVMKTEDEDIAYLYEAVTVLPTAFHRAPEKPKD